MAQVCRLIVHSFRKELQQKIQTDNHSPRQILDGIDKENDAVLEDSSTEINIKKIYNYILNNDANSLDSVYRNTWYCYGTKRKFWSCYWWKPPLIQEIIFRLTRKLSIILFLNETMEL